MCLCLIHCREAVEIFVLSHRGICLQYASSKSGERIFKFIFCILKVSATALQHYDGRYTKLRIAVGTMNAAKFSLNAKSVERLCGKRESSQFTNYPQSSKSIY